MYNRSEGFFTGDQGTKIFHQAWEKKEAQGSVIVTHGHGEHTECYQRVFDFYKNDSWNFYAWDMRGHGRSEGKRGYVNHFNDYSRDFEIYLKLLFAAKIKKGPVVLLSHSMGGMVQLKFLIESYSEKDFPLIKAQVCSAPLLGLAVTVPPIKAAGAEIMSRLFPKITMWNELNYNMLTRDPAVMKEFAADPLRHDVLSSRVFLGYKENFYTLPNHADRIHLPTLFQLAEYDPVVSTPAAKSFFEKIGSAKKRIIVYGDDAKHEIYNDIIRQQVFQDMKKFLDGIIAGG